MERNRDSGRDTGRGRDSGRDTGRGRDDSRSERGGRDTGRDDPPARSERGGRDSGRGGRDSGRRSSAGFQYAGRTREIADKRATQGNQDFDKIVRDDIKMFSPKAGKNRIRIMPGTWGKSGEACDYGYDLFVHYGVGSDRASYLDLHSMKDEPDPIHEEMEALQRDRSAHEDDIKALKPKRRLGVFLVDRNNEGEGVQFWAMPWGLQKDITLVSNDEAGGVLNIDDPDRGYDVEFTKVGEGIKTEYKGASIARRDSSIRDEWLDYVFDNPIPDVLKFYSYDEINKVFSGGGQQSERDRGGDSSRSRQESYSRGSDRGGRDQARDEAPAERGRDSGRGRGREPEQSNLSWDDIHGMTGEELDALVAERDELAKIKPNEADSDAQLADWICEDLGIKDEPADPPPSRGRGREEAQPDKLAEMRARRERR